MLYEKFYQRKFYTSEAKFSQSVSLPDIKLLCSDTESELILVAVHKYH